MSIACAPCATTVPVCRTTVTMVVGSEEYIYEELCSEVGGELVDLSGDVLEVAIWPFGTPPPWDWEPATWDPDVTPPTNRGRALIGVAPFVLAVGTYNVRWQVHDSPELVILGASLLRVVAS